MDTLVGYVAAFCTTAAYFPQALKVFRTKQTRDISLGMYILMTTGLSAWLVYGIMISSQPIIIANIVTLILDLYILAVKIIQGKYNET